MVQLEEKIEKPLNDIIKTDWKPQRIGSGSGGKGSPGVKAELDSDSGGTVKRILNRVRGKGLARGVGIKSRGMIMRGKAKGKGRGGIVKGSSKGRSVIRTIKKVKKGKGKGAQRLSKGGSKGSSKGKGRKMSISKGSAKGSGKQGREKGSSKGNTKGSWKDTSTGSTKGSMKRKAKGSAKGAYNGSTKGSNKGAYADDSNGKRVNGMNLWWGVSSIKGRGKLSRKGDGKGMVKRKGKGKGKGKGMGKGKREGKASGRGLGGGRGVGRGKGPTTPMGESMRVRRLGGILKKGRGAGKGTKGRGKGLALATISKSLGKGSNFKGSSRGTQAIMDGDAYEEPAEYEQRKGKSKGKGKGRADNKRSQNWVVAGDAMDAAEPLDNPLTAEDRQMMKKITIVAQLDKVPNPPAVMQGIHMGKSSKRASNGSDEGSLSSRFGANFGR